MTIAVDISYNEHGACGCAYLAQQQEIEATMPEVPIIKGLDSSEMVDRILAMRRQEECEAYRVSDYLSQSSAAAAAAVEGREDGESAPWRVDVDGECRAKMAEWFYQLVDFCRVDRDNVAVAVSYLDRFLSAARSGNARARRCLADRREYQLCAMTCLYLAVNLAETKEMDTALLVELSHGKYSKSDFVTMAEDVTWGLGWRLNGPTSMAFVNHLLGVLPQEEERRGGQHKSLHHLHDRHFLPACCRRAALVREEATLHELCRTQAELAVSDYRLASCRPSDVATAAVRNAMEHVRPDDLLAFLKSMDALDINPFSAEVERARTILKSAFDANVDGLRQVTSLLRLREEAQAAATAGADNNDIRGIRRSSITDSARCVTEIERIQNQTKFRREDIGEGATP